MGLLLVKIEPSYELRFRKMQKKSKRKEREGRVNMKTEKENGGEMGKCRNKYNEMLLKAFK